ncbi:MAG: bifunctional aspartate kinase/homoserine dehydrogenase I, partial [Spirochaetaceae bacterium]|nr:bifunctional aspartate kinase/homoserine dehydrogenase I [Spirochaetaceae bacterium]
MLTLKFGGTSMGNAQRILSSTDIMISRSQQDRISVVVSAVAGVSNKLQESIDGCLEGKKAESFISNLRQIHLDICNELASSLKGFDSSSVMKTIQPNFDELQRLLEAVSAFGECPSTVYCRIMGMGELLCAPIVEAVLLAKQQKVLRLDSREYIYTIGNQQEGDPDYVKTSDAFAKHR